MDLWRLKVFCKVIEYRSFSLAGQAVHLSQPTVSSHIKELEDYFGCQLIDRLAREALPTKPGELLYAYACRLLALKAETEAAMAEIQGSVKGTIVIGGSTIPGVYLLPRLVGDFKAAYPEVNVTLIVADSQRIIADILAGTLEMGIVGTAASGKRLSQVALIEDELRLVVSARHRWAGRKRVDLAALLAEPFIQRESGSGTRACLQQGLARHGLSVADFNIVAEMGSTEAVIQGVKAGAGVSILSPLAVADRIQAGQLKILTVENLRLRRYFYLTRHRLRSTSPLCRIFTEFVLLNRQAATAHRLPGGTQNEKNEN